MVPPSLIRKSPQIHLMSPNRAMLLSDMEIGFCYFVRQHQAVVLAAAGEQERLQKEADGLAAEGVGATGGVAVGGAAAAG